MLRVPGILLQQVTRKHFAFAAMDESPILAALGHRTFSMERMPLGGNAAIAVARRFVAAALAAQTASCIDQPHTSSTRVRSTG